MRLRFPKRTEACLFTLTEGSLERSLGKEKRREKLSKRKWTRDRQAVCIAEAEFGFLAYGCKLNSYWHAALWYNIGEILNIRVNIVRVKYS